MVFDIKPLRSRWNKTFELYLSIWIEYENIVVNEIKWVKKVDLLDMKVINKYEDIIFKLKETFNKLKYIVEGSRISLLKQDKEVKEIFLNKVENYFKELEILQKITNNVYFYELLSEDVLKTYRIIIESRLYTT